jgi:hypothetical protein
LETTQKVWDHIQLCTVAAGIYGPMLIVLAMRASEKRGAGREVVDQPGGAAWP